MICALLVFQTTSSTGRSTSSRRGSTCSPASATTSSPTSKRRRIAGSSRRTPRSTGCPYDPRVTYIAVGRDPRDVALSWDNHVANMDFDAMIDARATAVGLDDLAELFPDGIPERARLGDRALLAVGRRSRRLRPQSTLGGLAAMLHHLSTFWARARSAQRRALPLRRAEGRSRRPDAPAGRAARHLRSRGTLAPARRCRDVRAHARRRRPHRARHDPRDLAGQPAVLPPRRQRPVAQLLDDDGLRRYNARVSPSSPNRISRRGCTANRSRRLERSARSPRAITGKVRPTIGSSSPTPIRTTSS